MILTVRGLFGVSDLMMKARYTMNLLSACNILTSGKGASSLMPDTTQHDCHRRRLPVT